MQNLVIETVKVDDLVPYANNAKLHPKEQVEQIAKSIQDFGNNDPIAVWHNKEGQLEVVEGHGRLMALKMLGEEECQVIVLDHMTDEQRRAYVHIHNKLTMNSEFDFDILNSELQELMEFEEFDFGDFGFSVVEIDDDLNEVFDQSYEDTPNIGKVVYEPKSTSHEVEELYRLEREDLLGMIRDIENEELKNMFIVRYQWFAEFNFAKVADYYAYQATPKEQRVFEALGLVLLDRDQMIQNGFAEVSGVI